MAVRLAVVQPRTLAGDEGEQNVARALDAIARAAREGADLVCLPETYPGPFRVPLTYDAKGAMAAAARQHRVYLVSGAIEYAQAGGSGKDPCHCALCLFDPDGREVGTYRRTTPPGPWIYEGRTLWDFKYQEAEELPVFETRFGKVGLLICSEVYVPELARVLAVRGAEIILLPAGVAKHELWHTWRALIWARAIENLAYTATCQNLLAPEDEGLAMICSPEEILVESTSEGIFSATLDLERIRWLRQQRDASIVPRPWRTKPGLLRDWYRPALYRKNLSGA